MTAPNPTPRLELLAAMPVPGEELLTANGIAKRVGKNASTIDQMLHALRLDGLVDFEYRDGARYWWRTSCPIPATFTSTATPREHVGFDDRALREAFGVPKFLAPPRPTRIVLLKK